MSNVFIMFLRIGTVYLISIIMCSAKITINIKTDSNYQDVKINVAGYDTKLVTDKEIALFNITKENLMEGVRIELGRYPEDIFLRDQTPYGNLFKDFEWEEVKRYLQITKTKLLHIVNENKVMDVHEYVNTASSAINITFDVFKNVENTIYSFYSEHGLPKDELFYNIDVKFEGNRYKYENKWRNETVRTVRTKFGVKKRGVAEVFPGETVISELTGQKTIILIENEYTAKLIGNIVTDYENLYGKYHFYAPTIGNIMRAANLVNEVKTTEWIEIRCYTEPKLRVFYKDTGMLVPFHFTREDFRVSKNDWVYGQ